MLEEAIAVDTSKPVFETEYMRLEFVEGVVKGTFKKQIVNLDTAKKIVQKRLEYTNHQDMPILITDVGLKSIEREAREYFSSDSGVAGISASALVVKTALGKHLARFFMTITIQKPKIPTKVFSNETEAITWLKGFL